MLYSFVLRVPFFQHRTMFPDNIQQIVQFSDDEHNYSWRRFQKFEAKSFIILFKRTKKIGQPCMSEEPPTIISMESNI